MSPLPLFERDLTINNTTTTTHTISITVTATIATVAVVAVFMGGVIVVVIVAVVEIVEVVASFMEEVMVFVVVVIAAVVEVDVHADDDIDPEESVNIWPFFALEFTQETPQSICSKDVALWNILDMSVTAETSHADRSWLKDCALRNMNIMSVTADTSHNPIGPFGVAEQMPTGDSLMHASTASWSSVLFRGANAAVTPTRKSFTFRVLGGCWCADGRGLGVYGMSRVVSDRHSPRSEGDEIKRAMNKNDNKVISTICTLCTHAHTHTHTHILCIV